MDAAHTLTAAKTPPMPKGHWLFGVGPEVARSPLDLYRRVWREHGDVVLMKALPWFKWYLVIHPDGVERVLQTNQANYRKPKMLTKSIGLITGNGLVVNEGESWRKQRRLAQPAFHRQRLALLGERMTQAAEQMAEQWSDTYARTHATFDVAEEMTKLTIRIAAETLFSADITGDGRRFTEALKVALGHVSFRMRYPFAPPEFVPTKRNRDFLRARRTLDEIVFKIIQTRRRENSDKGDLLSMLMLARDEETDESMNNQQVKDEVMTLLIAGHETTAAGLAWTWLLLARNERARLRLQKELNNSLQGKTPGIEDLPQLSYARMVFEETMRLYPPAWGQPRQSIKADQVCGFHIEPNRMVVVSQFLTHRHPAFWEQPEEFIPERFTPENSANRPRFAYFPFGGGARQCIGNHFAMMEAQFVIAVLASRFNLTLPVASQPELDPTFALRPKNGLKMQLSN